MIPTITKKKSQANIHPGFHIWPCTFWEFFTARPFLMGIRTFVNLLCIFFIYGRILANDGFK